MCSTKITKYNVQKKPKNGASLDTLAQLSTLKQNGHKKLIKRQIAKSITLAQLFPLIDLNSPLKKSYWNTYHCNNVMIQEGHKFESKYCNARWCTVCNRIRMAKMIKAYSIPLVQFKDMYFVTLTAPNVKGEQLKDEVNNMLKSFQRIRQNLHKQNITFKGIRKLECTYNPRTGFNPHMHILLDGKEVAEKLVELWLKRNKAARRKAQDIRKADKNSLLELFKYTVKGIHKGKFYAKALDTIYQALHNRRTYQPFGIRKVVEEDINGIKSEDITFKGFRNEIWRWSKDAKDWFNDGGELLTEYIIEGKLCDWIEELTMDELPEPDQEQNQITINHNQRTNILWSHYSELTDEIIKSDTS